MAKESLVLALDCGTQSIRGLVFNKQGELLVKVKKEIQPYFSLRPGWTEQDPDLYYNSICEIGKEIKENHSEIHALIKAVTVTTQRDSCVLVDIEGKPIRPAILWMDQRQSKPKSLALPYQISTNMVGMRRVAGKISRQCKAHWIQENEPENWEKTHKFLLLSAYLNFKLTGRYVDSIGSTIGHIPLNYKKFKWESNLGLKKQIFRINDERLYEVVEPGSVIGTVSKEVSDNTGIAEGAVIIASASDKGCETLGVGCINSKSVSISMGSHATIQTTTEKYYELNRFIPPFPAAIPKHYNPELQIFRGYWMLTWFKKEFAKKEMEEAKVKGISPEVLLNKYLNHIPPGSDGLILQPYWGPPIKSPEARGSIIGFSDYHTRVHIYKAIIEGIAYSLNRGMKAIEKKSGHEVERVLLSGGGSQSDAICQITADVFNKNVYRVQTHETSGLGASIICYVGLGVYNSYEEAIQEMVRVTDSFQPNSENVQVYDAIYHRVYKNIYGRMRPLYQELKDIYKSRSEGKWANTKDSDPSGKMKHQKKVHLDQ